MHFSVVLLPPVGAHQRYAVARVDVEAHAVQDIGLA